jgi:hypothetical protein
MEEDVIATQLLHRPPSAAAVTTCHVCALPIGEHGRRCHECEKPCHSHCSYKVVDRHTREIICATCDTKEKEAEKKEMEECCKNLFSSSSLAYAFFGLLLIAVIYVTRV